MCRYGHIIHIYFQDRLMDRFDVNNNGVGYHARLFAIKRIEHGHR